MLRIGQVESSATADGKYTDGSVAGGIAATRLRAAAFNAIQEELANIVESAGMTLDPDDVTQVLAALKNQFLSRVNPFADIKADGAAAVAAALSNLGLGDDNGYVGRKIAEQWITSSKLLTLNPRTEYFKVVITGAGGGAGGAFNGGGSNDNFSGGGGAAGGTGIKWFRVADVTNWAVVIGSGGTEATKGGGFLIQRHRCPWWRSCCCIYRVCSRRDRDCRNWRRYQLGGWGWR